MATEKLDLKKVLRELYEAPVKVPVIVKVPEQTIVSVVGKGNPNTAPEYQNAVEALFSISYKIKFTYKKLGKDYSVLPLEGLWWAKDLKDLSSGNKDNWLWKMLIVQPDFVSKEVFDSVVENLNKEKNLPALSKVEFETFNEGISAQILHIGPFADEGPTIAKLHDFIRGKGYSFDGLIHKHHEIYLSDIRKTAPEKWKTIIRQPFFDPKTA